MLLSKLVYEAIKNVIYYDDASFTYDEFMKGTFDESPDYVNQINNILTPINEALSRLSDLERVPYKVIEVNVTNKVITLPDDCKEVVAVGLIARNGIKTYEYLNMGADKIYVDTVFPKLSLEYKVDIRIDEYKGNSDINLKSLGINDQMCQYIIEYAMGKLYEPISADVANMHLIRAENYFSGIRVVRPALIQKCISSNYKIGM